MKYLILILLLVGCTDKFNANSSVECPCTVITVHGPLNSGNYKITVMADNGYTLSFYTKKRHLLGDTIQ